MNRRKLDIRMVEVVQGRRQLSLYRCSQELCIFLTIQFPVQLPDKSL